MGAEINSFYRSASGGKAHIKVSGDTFAEAAKEYVDSIKFIKDSEWTEDSNFGAAEKVFGKSGGAPVPPTSPFPANSLVCVEDGGTISGMTVQGKRFSAEEIASGRDKKSRELSLTPPGPRCDDCWAKGGYAGRYKAMKGYK